jgi:hypothetical protein
LQSSASSIPPDELLLPLSSGDEHAIDRLFGLKARGDATSMTMIDYWININSRKS